MVVSGLLLGACGDSNDDLSDVVGTEAPPATETSTTVIVDKVATTAVAEIVATTSVDGVVSDQSVVEFAEAFIAKVNERDAAAVATLAPDATLDTRDFMIGGGPYESVSCSEFDGRTQCLVSNDAAAFEFHPDVNAGQIVGLTYVGGA